MSKIEVHMPIICLTPRKFGCDPNKLYFKSEFYSRKPSFRCRYIKRENSHKTLQGFSVLKSNFQCDYWNIWSIMAFYELCLHIPLSFGGLSVVAMMLHQSVLDPQTEILSILVIQSLVLIGTSLLLRLTDNVQNEFLSLFQANENSKERNWFLASVLGFGFLLLVVDLTSLLADILIGPKEVNNPVLKEILSSGYVSVAACILVYCVITPLLEETVYRGFLLASLASKMKWQQAVLVSSAVFSALHFSADNFLQLLIIGSVLGCSYCWTGNLRSSVVIHSLYNALTILHFCLNCI